MGLFGGSLGVSIIAIKATKSWMTNFLDGTQENGRIRSFDIPEINRTIVTKKTFGVWRGDYYTTI